MSMLRYASTGEAVAPPRGERGLKLLLPTMHVNIAYMVAPPRGERGLK